MRLLLIIILMGQGMAQALETQGDIAYGHTTFFEKDDNSENEDRQVILEAYFRVAHETEKWFYQFEGFGRVDEKDPERNIAAPLDTYIRYQGATNSLSVGYHIFNWSVLEFFHPVDTINSRNFDIAGEKNERLGAPSIVYSTELESTLVQLILMPFHVDPKLPSEKNRASYQMDFATPRYMTGDEESQRWPQSLQYGIRLKKFADPVEFDFQVFRKYATHVPFFMAPGPAMDIMMDNDNFEIVPHYFPMTQVSVALTVPVSESMYKMELAYYDLENYEVSQVDYDEARYPPLYDATFKPRDYGLFANGLEYTHNYESGQEGTYFAEHQLLFDLNSKLADRYSFFQNDLALGYRHNFNNFNSWDIIGSYIIDSKEPTQSVFNLSTSFRFMQDYKFESALRVINSKAVASDITNLEEQTGLRPLRLSDNIQFKVTKYF